MACKGFWECLLKLLNFVLTLSGLAVVGYGVYLFVMFQKSSSGESPSPSPPISPTSSEMIQLGRPMLIAVSLSSSFLDNLPKAWFIYLFIGVGAVLFVVSCFGCIAAATRSGCCLSCYAFLLILLILVEVGCGAFIFFDHDWKEVIPSDKTGNFDVIYDFLDDHWDVIRWVALGIIIFQAVLFLLALIVKAANAAPEYDSDEEYIGGSRQQVRQPLINNRQQAPATGVPVAGNLDTRPSRNDAWSARMREKYGLDTSEFTYNPSDNNRHHPAAGQPAEEPRRCTIM